MYFTRYLPASFHYCVSGACTLQKHHLNTTVCSIAPRHCTMLLAINTLTCSSRWRLGSYKQNDNSGWHSLLRHRIHKWISWRDLKHVQLMMSGCLYILINFMELCSHGDNIGHHCHKRISCRTPRTCLPTFLMANCSGVIVSSSSSALLYSLAKSNISFTVFSLVVQCEL